VRRNAEEESLHHVERTDRGLRSCDIPRRMPPTPSTWVPSTVAVTGAGEDRSSSLPVPASRSRRPHFVPRLGASALDGPCKHRPGHHCPCRFSRVRCAFDNQRLVKHPPPPDDESEPAWPSLGGLGSGWLPALYRPRPQRLDGFYDREPAALIELLSVTSDESDMIDLSNRSASVSSCVTIP
jgi:hypothetical protein